MICLLMMSVDRVIATTLFGLMSPEKKGEEKRGSIIGIRQTISVAADVASILEIQFNTFQRLFKFYIYILDICSIYRSKVVSRTT
jgi:hypothetical protein